MLPSGFFCLAFNLYVSRFAPRCHIKSTASFKAMLRIFFTASLFRSLQGYLLRMRIFLRFLLADPTMFSSCDVFIPFISGLSGFSAYSKTTRLIFFHRNSGNAGFLGTLQDFREPSGIIFHRQLPYSHKLLER